MIMNAIAKCNSILEKIMSAHSDFFNGDKSIFDYVGVVRAQFIKIYIIDDNLPDIIGDEIAQYYQVVNF